MSVYLVKHPNTSMNPMVSPVAVAAPMEGAPAAYGFSGPDNGGMYYNNTALAPPPMATAVPVPAVSYPVNAPDMYNNGSPYATASAPAAHSTNSAPIVLQSYHQV